MAGRSNKGFWIAIDGPAGTGKTSVGRRLARQLGFQFINTGAMYRAVAWGLKQGLSLAEMEVKVCDERIILNNMDITAKLYDEELDRLASKAARQPQVRRFLIRKQRELVQGRDVVMEGRDIGRVVLAEAEAKIFLEATLAERARRRGGQRAGSVEEIEQELRARDKRDQGFGRLEPTGDAVVIVTDGLTIDEVVIRAVEVVQRALRKRG